MALETLRVVEIAVLTRLVDTLRANQILIWICLITLVNQLGFGMVIPVLPLFVQTFGGTAGAVGAAVALYGLGRLLFDLPMGQLTERLGRRQVFIVGEVITVVGTLLCALAPTYNVLLIGRFIGGVGGATVLTVGQIIVADVSKRENRGHMMGVYMSFFQFAVGIGPVVGGLVATALGPRAPFLAFAVLAAVAGFVGARKLVETRGLGERSSHATSTRAVYRELLGNSSFLFIGAIGFASTAAPDRRHLYRRARPGVFLVPLFGYRGWRGDYLGKFAQPGHDLAGRRGGGPIWPKGDDRPRQPADRRCFRLFRVPDLVRDLRRERVALGSRRLACEHRVVGVCCRPRAGWR